MAGTPEDRFRAAVAGIIESAAQSRATTAELWAELRPTLRDAGLVTEGGQNVLGRTGVQIVNEIRSRAVARRTGYQRFARATPGDLFTQAMAAPEENIRPATERSILPKYLARFDLTFLKPDGSTETQTVSVRSDWRPGMTVQDVLDDVAEAAEGLGLDYGQGAVGFANVRPVMV